MTEFDFWEAYNDYLKELHWEPDTLFVIEYCNKEGITHRFPIDNVTKSTSYRGCFEADCLSNYNYDERIDSPVTTSHRTFSYNNVKKTYLG